MKKLRKWLEYIYIYISVQQKSKIGGSSYLLESPLLECGVIGTI